jgi:hypothetical protein
MKTWETVHDSPRERMFFRRYPSGLCGVVFHRKGKPDQVFRCSGKRTKGVIRGIAERTSWHFHAPMIGQAFDGELPGQSIHAAKLRLTKAEALVIEAISAKLGLGEAEARAYLKNWNDEALPPSPTPQARAALDQAVATAWGAYEQTRPTPRPPAVADDGRE